MNRKLLALAVAAAAALPLAAQAAPTVYGQLNLSVDKASTTNATGTVSGNPDGDESWQVNSNSSRLGIMGEEALGNGLSAVYKIEYGVQADEAGTNDLTGRDRYLGLKGSLGTVKLGAYDSPLKSSQGSVDQFNDGRYTDMTGFGAVVGDNRMSNLIGYESPKFADAITAKVAIQPGESAATGDNELANAFSLAVAYEAAGLYAALAYDKNVNSGVFDPADNRDTIRLTGTYTAGAMQLGAMLQTSEMSDEVVGGQDDQDAVLLSAGFGMDDKNVAKAQFIYTKEDFGAGGDAKRMTLELGLDHNFTKQTKAYAQAAYAKTDADSGDFDDAMFGVGMLTKF
ncbi:MAG: porin [Pedobacter sp.]|nr:porin [Pedobacter sp.]